MGEQQSNSQEQNIDEVFELRAKKDRELTIFRKIINNTEYEIVVTKEMSIEVTGRGINIYTFKIEDLITYKNHIRSYNMRERDLDEVESFIENLIIRHTNMNTVSKDFINNIMYMINNENIQYNLRNGEKLNDVFDQRKSANLLEIQNEKN